MIGLGIGGRSIGLGLGRSAGAAAFVGAYDAIPNIVAAYGMRRLRSAYTGSILRLRRSSDNVESDIGYDGSGHLDTAAVATFIGAGSGYIVNWYDQSGNGYAAAQVTAANQPLYVASGQAGRSVARFDGVNDEMLAAAMIVGHWLIACRPTGIQSYGSLLSIVRHMLIRDGDSANLYFSTHSLFGAAIASGNMRKNGVFSTVLGTVFGLFETHGPDPLPPLAPEILRLGRDTAGGTFGSGDIAELIICNAALSDANRQAAEAAANTYWAIY